MPEYPFTGPFPRVFSDLCYGEGVSVLRDGKPVEADAGQTVELQPGDVLVTADAIEWAHPELEGAPQPEPVEDAAEAPAEATADEVPPVDPPAAAKRRKGADTPPADGDASGDNPPADIPA